MSGHSKWSKIKRQKGAEDAKRGILFTKLTRVITLAARQDGNPVTNFKLRLAVDQARAANMPKENIERAIRKGTGDSSGEIEEIQYEGFLPGGIALIINILTDNKNRTASTVKHLLGKYGGNLGAPNSALWMFEKKGIIRITNCQSRIKDLDKFELNLIDLGTEDFEVEETDLIIYTKPEDLQKIKENLEKQNIGIDYAEIEWMARDKIKLPDPELKKKLESLCNELDDENDINSYFTNVKDF